MLGDDEAPPQGLVGQSGGCDQVQGIGGIQHQQADGVVGEGLADGRGGALQTHAIGQIGGQIVEKRFFIGCFIPSKGIFSFLNRVKNTVFDLYQ